MNFEKYAVTEPDVFPLVLSKRLIRILKDIDDNISDEIIELASKKVKFRETFIDRTDKEDMITFITSDKVNKMIQDGTDDIETECWSSPQRIETRIGRLVVRLLGEKMPPGELENFVNEYKSIITAKKLSRRFKVVEGEDIRKWYLLTSYSESKGGNLKNSCMRHVFCQEYLDIYTNNQEKVKLLILLDETREKILGRSLIWKLDRPEGKIFMDRVYFSDDFILNIFINYAIKRDWIYRLENMDNLLHVVSNNTVKNETLLVKIKNENYNNYPFVDNLCFYDPKSGSLTNNPKYLRSIGCEEYFDLCDNLGGYELRNDFDF